MYSDSLAHKVHGKRIPVGSLNVCPSSSYDATVQLYIIDGITNQTSLESIDFSILAMCDNI